MKHGNNEEKQEKSRIELIEEAYSMIKHGVPSEKIYEFMDTADNSFMIPVFTEQVRAQIRSKIGLDTGKAAKLFKFRGRGNERGVGDI